MEKHANGHSDATGLVILPADMQPGYVAPEPEETDAPATVPVAAKSESSIRAMLAHYTRTVTTRDSFKTGSVSWQRHSAEVTKRHAELVALGVNPDAPRAKGSGSAKAALVIAEQELADCNEGSPLAVKLVKRIAELKAKLA